MQINNLENRKIYKTEGWFFEKIDKKLIKKKTNNKTNLSKTVKAIKKKI